MGSKGFHMTPEQMQMVRLTLAQATTGSLQVAEDFYRRLFVIAPDLRARFRGDIDMESAKLTDALTLAFGLLSDTPHMVATLEKLARHGLTHDLPEHHCRAIAQSLLWAIEKRIGSAFTPQVCNAWIAFLSVIVSILRPVVAERRVRAA